MASGVFGPLSLKIIKAFSLFSMITGSMDVLSGVSLIASMSGSSLTGTPTSLALADSQLRFLGAMWAGYGAMLWWASNDPQTRRFPLAMLGGILFVSGIGRVISGLSRGFNATWVKVATVVELVGPIVSRPGHSWIKTSKVLDHEGPVYYYL
ncbi:conserved hypothetical protein [Talaromyces stipitatus ATCC 10500]|uniref:Uncharacterized protein n=1 Tax=Talaromyces stipitatus (strain ATCC 10500 / CBS 375.48 / QM 6759 / NRRL 1006) TaxID=441959 RepID=B8M1I4_TALSN|nr:uncharacterized protein TSTA_091210 [Talaromyces stipitatus ATCC 10500]EED21880.1 conserved hypothetical protein [Talaromyces stipitatus ATCC 10500]